MDGRHSISLRQFTLGLFLWSGILLPLNAKMSSDQEGFGEITISFPSHRPFSYEWQKADNTLLLRFPKSTPADLENINNYDERFIRRVTIKDLGPEGSEVRLVLKTKDTRAVVTNFNDPFRITIDFFDKNFREPKDPETGLPIAASLNPSPDSAAESSPKNYSLGENTTSTRTDPQGLGTKRRLIQPLPEEINSPNELASFMSKIEPGIGKAWASYPPYIYRMQLAPYEGREAPKSEISPFQTKALSTTSAMADYASKLFDFGHEGRALIAYQQVLQREPGVFEHDALHLWKFAESHFGQGNVTLAHSYYQTLIDKHPDHIMAKFAQLRLIDIQAIKAIQNDDFPKLTQLVEQASKLQTQDNAELKTLIAIRMAWWSDSSLDQHRRNELPTCTEETQTNLTRLLPKVENPKTAYLASSMIANRMTNSKTPWQNDYAPWLASFFDRYRNLPGQIRRDELTSAAKIRLTQQFKTLFDANQYGDLIGLYESLPKTLKGIEKDPHVAWQIGESYRVLGQPSSSLALYANAAKNDDSIDRFKSNFWLATLADKEYRNLKATRGHQGQSKSLDASARNADIAMTDIWKKLRSDERSLIMTALSNPLQDVVASPSKLRTPPRIVLEQYKTALTNNPPKINAENGTSKTDWMGNFSPSGSTVKLLDDLGKKFAELGMTTEHREAIELMKLLKPSQFEQDKEAVKLWAAELTKLAEDHRKSDEFLEAGELYTLIGDSTTLTETKAEALYKGGLLLFRAGKKQDAISALQKAKSDVSNLFYSKLATERLNQIESK